MRDHSVTEFKHGQVDEIEAQSIPEGAASSALNWLTRGDRIELRRGYAPIGPISCASGQGRISGLHTAYRNDGTPVLFRKRGRRIEWFDEGGQRWEGTGYEETASSKASNAGPATAAQSMSIPEPSIHRAGQSFAVPEDFKPTSVKFFLKKDGSPTGNGYAKIFLCEPNGVPAFDADPVAVSDPIDVSGLTGSFVETELVFTGAQQAVLKRCERYAVVFEYKEGSIGNYVDTGYKEAAADGQAFVLFYGNWDISPDNSVPFTLYGKYKGLILPEAAEDEDMSFSGYATNAGSMMFFSSPNSGIYKVMTANPSDYTDMYYAPKNFKGHIAIHENRMHLFGRVEDKTGHYGSYVDNAKYTTVSDEPIGSGDGSALSFSATLAFRSGTRRTCFGLSVTDGVETFRDDYDGNLVGSAGGTGTVNYTTGEVSVTFAAPPAASANNVLCSYQWEDSNDNGVTDFTKSTPRLAGEGFVFRQDDGGGDHKGMASINDTHYCLHERRTWALTLGATDTDATNKPYRQTVGVPTHKAYAATADGIYYLDTSNPSKPLFNRLYLSGNTSEVLPKQATESIDLSGYDFSDCWMLEWGEYIVFSGKKAGSAANDRLFAYHKQWKSVDVLDYFSSCAAVYRGTLVLGDSVSEAVYTAFSGFDDDDSSTDNQWTGKVSDMGFPGWLKKCKSLVVEGEIQDSQALEVYFSDDRGGFVLAGTVSGDGAYVDKGSAVSIGSNTIGSKEVGGGGDGATAYHYLASLPVDSDKFEVRQVKYVATGLGYVSVSRQLSHDVRLRKQKIPRKYRA